MYPNNNNGRKLILVAKGYVSIYIEQFYACI